jgi:hypothetical protein
MTDAHPARATRAAHVDAARHARWKLPEVTAGRSASVVQGGAGAPITDVAQGFAPARLQRSARAVQSWIAEHPAIHRAPSQVRKCPLAPSGPRSC